MFTKVGMTIIGQQGLWISVRLKKQAHNACFKSLAEGQMDLPTQIDYMLSYHITFPDKALP